MQKYLSHIRHVLYLIQFNHIHIGMCATKEVLVYRDVYWNWGTFKLLSWRMLETCKDAKEKPGAECQYRVDTYITYCSHNQSKSVRSWFSSRLSGSGRLWKQPWMQTTANAKWTHLERFQHRALGPLRELLTTRGEGLQCGLYCLRVDWILKHSHAHKMCI